MSHSRKHKTNYNVTDTPTPGSTKRRRRNLNAHLNKTDVLPHSHSTSPLSPTPSTTTYAASSTDTTYPHDLLTDEAQQFSNSPQKQTPPTQHAEARHALQASPTIGQLTNVVYEATCTLCQQTYIGQTRRKLHDRIREHTNAARKHDYTSAFGEHYANTHPNTTTPPHHLQDPQTNKWHTTTTHRGSLRHPNKIPTTKPTRRTPWNGFPHLTLTTYSTDNTPLTIHSTDNTLNWHHTPLTTHSTDKTLYRQHALLLTALSPELANSTPSRTRQQHLHPSHNLQSPLSYVHSYPRTTGFLSLYYTYAYFAP